MEGRNLKPMLTRTRLLLFVCSLLGVVGCGRPGWYVARDVRVPGQMLVGYGEGETMAEARADAAREIAEALRVSVDSSGEVVVENDGKGSAVSSRFRVALASRVTLKELTVVKLSRVLGRCYAALSYDTRTLFQRVEGALGRSTAVASPTGAGFKAHLPLAERLATLGLSPSEFRVTRRQGGWELSLKNHLFSIDSSTWFRFLFVEQPENRGLALAILPGGRLASGSRYQVRITPPLALGYLSLYLVSESGQTVSLVTNRPVDGLGPVIFPDERLYSGLEAIARSDGGSRDMLLAVWTEKPLEPMGSHLPVSETPLPETDERAFSYGELLEHLDDALWATRFVWIDG